VSSSSSSSSRSSSVSEFSFKGIQDPLKDDPALALMNKNREFVAPVTTTAGFDQDIFPSWNELFVEGFRVQEVTEGGQSMYFSNGVDRISGPTNTATLVNLGTKTNVQYYPASRVKTGSQGYSYIIGESPKIDFKGTRE